MSVRKQIFSASLLILIVISSLSTLYSHCRQCDHSHHSESHAHHCCNCSTDHDDCANHKFAFEHRCFNKHLHILQYIAPQSRYGNTQSEDTQETSDNDFDSSLWITRYDSEFGCILSTTHYLHDDDLWDNCVATLLPSRAPPALM